MLLAYCSIYHMKYLLSQCSISVVVKQTQINCLLFIICLSLWQKIHSDASTMSPTASAPPRYRYPCLFTMNSDFVRTIPDVLYSNAFRWPHNDGSVLLRPPFLFLPDMSALQSNNDKLRIVTATDGCRPSCFPPPSPTVSFYQDRHRATGGPPPRSGASGSGPSRRSAGRSPQRCAVYKANHNELKMHLFECSFVSHEMELTSRSIRKFDVFLLIHGRFCTFFNKSNNSRFF